MLITVDYIQQLKQATLNVLSLCETINVESETISGLNKLLTRKPNNNLIFKVERIFISDIIYVFSKVKNLNERSQFGLAYYYDAIRNRRFASENELEDLNKLVSTNAFKIRFNRILKENIFFELEDSKTYLLNYFKQNNHPKLSELNEAFSVFLKLVCDFDEQKNQEIHNVLAIDYTNYTEIKEEHDSLEKVLEELNQLVGLENVKRDVSELVNLLRVQQKRTSQGLRNIEITMHTVFLGPPGTGKTTVARLLSRIFKHLTFLSKGQLIETDREGMVAGYVGQTATKVDAIIEKAKGGVLFIDEAYSLSQNLGNDYGAEAINILLKRMEDFRDDFAVVVAGYDEPMRAFIDSNPGLKSRFNRYFYFNHFMPDELFCIFQNYCKNSDFILAEEAKEKLKDAFELLYEKRDDNFGNARVVRNIFEKCVQKQANRIVATKRMSKKTLRTITEDDVPEPKGIVKEFFNLNQ